MKINPVMLVPPLAVIAGIGYTIWPYLESLPTPPAVKPSSEVLLPKSLLSLKLPEESARDPFVRGLALVSIAPPSVALPSKSGPLPSSIPSTIPQEKSKRGLEAEGLTLGAVLVGTHRAAIINGKVYSLGETIVPADATRPHWQLARIETYGVILVDRQRRKPIALGFEPAATRADSQAATAAVRPAPTNPDLATLIGQLAGIDLSSLEGVLGPATAPSAPPSEPSKKGQH